jgi:hypothetical protein
MPMHLNSLTPMRICGTPRSFLNLDSRCPTSIEVVVIGGGLDSPLPTLGVGLVSINMSSSLSVVARSSLARHLTRRCETSLLPDRRRTGRRAAWSSRRVRAGRAAGPLRVLLMARAANGAGRCGRATTAPRHSDAPGLPLPMDGMGRNI